MTMKMQLQVMLPPLLLLMMMMICLYQNGCEKLVVMLWDTMTDMYAIIDDDVKTEAQTAEDIVREIRNKNEKCDPEEEEG